MADEKVYTPETIQDQPFPATGSELTYSADEPSGSETYRPSEIKNTEIKKKRIAVELIGASLNTKSRKILAEFQFTESGAVQVGKYENGVSGDVRISPNGIVARDLAGLITFALDATTGSAVFKGSVQSGSVITGAVQLGNNSILIDGDTQQMIFYEDDGKAAIVIGEV